MSISKNNHTSAKRSILFGALGLVVIIAGYISFHTLTRQHNSQAERAEHNTPITQNIKATATALHKSNPVRLRIQTIGIDAPITFLGLEKDGSLEVPKGDKEVGWYDKSPTPGETGPAVLVGHLDSPVGKPAIFFELRNLKTGDGIEVEREDGTIAKFAVENEETYSQYDFPTLKVYGPIDYPGLRLITCYGRYDKEAGHYTHNTVVYAKLIR